jgi:hypothetical protein
MNALHALRSSLLIALLALGTTACSKDKAKEGGGESASGGEAEAPTKDIKTLLSGKAPTLPAEFKGVAPLATLKEAKKAFPGLPDDSMFDGPYPDTSFRIYVPDDETEVQLVSVSILRPQALELVKAAWGEPTMTEDLGKKVPAWFNPEEGLRAVLSEGFSDSDNLEFTRYIPYEKFLGAEGKGFAFESAKTILGASVDDLRTAYAKEIVETNAEQAAKDRADLKKFAGDKVDILGDAKPSVRLDFLPTEYGSYDTRVHLSFGDDKLVERVWFGIDFRSRPEARDEILAFINKKLGEPKEEEEYGDPIWIYSTEPKIQLKEDTISKKWDITITPK